MTYYGIIMIIFGGILALIGLHIYTGHDFFLARGYFKPESKEYLKKTGIVMWCVSLAPILSGISSFFFKEEQILIPLLIFVIGLVLGFFIPIKVFQSKEK